MWNHFPWIWFVEMFLFEVEAASRKNIPSQILISAQNAKIAVFNSYSVYIIPHPTEQLCPGTQNLLG